MNKRIIVGSGAAVLGSASSAMATATTDLIDYASVATDLTAILQTAVGAAIGVGVLVLGARFGWRFFKSFTK